MEMFRGVCNSFLVATVFLGAVPNANATGNELLELVKRAPESVVEEREKAVKALDRYSRSQEKFKENLANRIQADIRNANSRKLASQDVLRQFEQQGAELITWMSNGGDLPQCNLTLEYAHAYGASSIKNRELLRPSLERLVKALSRNDAEKLGSKINEEFMSLSGILDAQNLIGANATLQGYRLHVPVLSPHSQKSLRIIIADSDGTRFAGTVERDWDFVNNPVHSFVGTLENLHFRGITGESVAEFGAQFDGSWNYEGIAMGGCVVGEFSGVARNGKRGQGYFMVRQK